MNQIAPMSVLLVEDAAPVRQRLRSLLAEVRTVDLIAEAATVADAINLFDTARPQSVVLDIGLPDGSGIDVLRHVREANSQCVVMVLSNYLEPETYNRCSELGADFLFSKSDEFEQAIETLRALSERKREASQEIATFARIRRAKLEVTSHIGLHARPAAMLVRVAQRLNADIKLSLNGRTASAKSILDVMMLCAGCGAEVTVAAEGRDADEAIRAITQLFESSFHEPRRPAAGPVNGGTILVAEDGTSARERIRMMLEKKGYQTVAAGNGVEAIALLTANPSDIQAVVLDMIMPEMNGAEVLLAIRRIDPDLPVLAISGSEGSEWFSRDRATAFLRKPFGMAELLPALRALLDGARNRRPGRLVSHVSPADVGEHNTNTGVQP